MGRYRPRDAAPAPGFSCGVCLDQFASLAAFDAHRGEDACSVPPVSVQPPKPSQSRALPPPRAKSSVFAPDAINLVKILRSR